MQLSHLQMWISLLQPYSQPWFFTSWLLDSNFRHSKFLSKSLALAITNLLYLHINRKLLASSVDKGWPLRCTLYLGAATRVTPCGHSKSGCDYVNTMLNCQWPCDRGKNPLWLHVCFFCRILSGDTYATSTTSNTQGHNPRYSRKYGAYWLIAGSLRSDTHSNF